MKNIQKSVLALTLLMATATQPVSFSWPSMPKMPTFSRSDINVTNGLAATAVVIGAIGVYKYRSEIKDAIVTAANAVKNGACAVGNVVMRNKVATAAAVTTLALGYYLYTRYNTPDTTKPNPELQVENKGGSTGETGTNTGDATGNTGTVTDVKTTVTPEATPTTTTPIKADTTVVVPTTPEIKPEVVVTPEVTPTNVTPVETQPAAPAEGK